MNTNLLNIVNRIVAEQGEGILADAKRLFPYFSDYAKNENKEERVAFGRCIEYGAYQELKRTRTLYNYNICGIILLKKDTRLETVLVYTFVECGKIKIP